MNVKIIEIFTKIDGKIANTYQILVFHATYILFNNSKLSFILKIIYVTSFVIRRELTVRIAEINKQFCFLFKLYVFASVFSKRNL